MSDSDGDVFHAMVEGKIHDIKTAIDEIEAEIKERRDIDEQTLGEIQDEILQIRNRILEVEQISGSQQKGSAFPFLEELEKEVLNL